MRRIDLTFRLIKAGGKVVSVAICAMTGMMIMSGSAMATSYFDSTTSGTTSAATDGVDGGTVYQYSTGPTSSTASRNSSTISDGVVLQQAIVAQEYVAIDNGANGSWSGSMYNSGGTTMACNYSIACRTNNSGANYSYYTTGAINNAGVTMNFGVGDAAAYIVKNSNYAQQYYVNQGVSGSNANYADGSYYLQNTGSTYTTTVNFAGGNNVAGVVGGTGTGYQIDNVNITGTGGITIGGRMYATNVTFTGGGASTFLNLNGGWTGTTLDFAGKNATVTLADGQTIVGNVDNTGNVGSGSFSFGGASTGNNTVSGSMGATHALNKITVDGDSATTVNAIGVRTAGNYIGIGGAATAKQLAFNANAYMYLNGLDTSSNPSTGGIQFNGYASAADFQSGNLTATAGTSAANTTANDTGTLTFSATSGTQTITGQVGSDTYKLANVNGGDTGGNTIFNQAVFSTNLSVLGGGTVTLANGWKGTTANFVVAGSTGIIDVTGGDINGQVTTATTGTGILKMDGTSVTKTQAVTGMIGTNALRLKEVHSVAADAVTTFQSDVFAGTVQNDNTGSSTFNANVTATTAINVNAGATVVVGDAKVVGIDGTTKSGNINITSGTGTFQNNVVATNVDIGTGVGNFNTVGGTTSANLVFNGNGTANLNQGITGNIDMGNNATATVNVSATKTITGSVTSTGGTAGIINFLGAGAITGNVGSSTTTGISQLNVNTGISPTLGAVVMAEGNVFAGVVNLKNAAELQLTTNSSVLTGTSAVALTGIQQVVTTDVNNTGTLSLMNGGNVVTGQVGANNMALAVVNTSGTDTFNNMVYATKVNVAADGTLILNGQSGLKTDLTQGDQTNSAIAGLKGTVDFGSNANASFLNIGDNVNLTTGTTGIQFANANASTLTFDGSSTVTGVVGGNTTGNSTFQTIQAGANSSTVTFKNDVYVSDAAQTTLDITGTGIVNLQGNLTGAVHYLGDGIVNVSDGKSIITTQTQAATTSATNTGTLNFLGGTTLSADIGTSVSLLKAVNFNSGSNNVTQTINHNVYATDVSLNGATGTISTATTAGVYDYAGATNMTTYTTTTGTTYNIANGVTLGGTLGGVNVNNPTNGATVVNFANGATDIINGALTVGSTGSTAINLGTAHVAVNGNVVTNGASISATVNTTDITINNASSTSIGSGQVTATGILTMTGAEKVQINYVGSLKQGGFYDLITATSNTGYTGVLTNVTDNSFAIDTTVSTDASGHLVVTADRTGGATYAANQDYAVKSNTVGNFSNNAAAVIAGLAAAGTQTGDMVQVIQKLEIDSFGYGNTAANLATQVKRLAPIANASLSEAAFGTTNLTVNTIDSRVGSLRGDSVASANGSGISAGDAAKTDGFWLKGYGSMANQNASGQYDGYKLNTGGVAMGADTRLNADGLIGIAISDASTKVDQQDFRLGDSTTLKSVQLTGYGSYDISKELYIDGDVSYTGNKYTGNRAAAVGRTAQASFNGNQVMARLGAGYRIALEGKSVFTPMASIESSHLSTDAYTETGAGALNLAVASQSLDRTRFGLGGRLNTEAESGGTIYRPQLSAMWLHDSGTLTKDTVASFTGGGGSFTTPGADVVRNTVDIGAGVAITTGKDSSVLVQYDYATHSGYHAQTVQATGRWGF